MTIKVLVSVYNISGYLIAELEELSKCAEIAVIETPCTGIGKGLLEKKAKWIDRTKLKSADEVEAALADFKPDLFLCGGWADKLMVRFARTLRKRGTKTVLMIDTPWQSRIRQLIHCCYSRFYLSTTYDFAWGAGEPQARYLRYLGFPKSHIRTGVYCADTKKFAPIGANKVKDKGEGEQWTWPHSFLYIGRYVAVKNMRRMERAFLRALEQMPESDWKLRCIGGGRLWNERTIHPRIEHLGYKSPAEIQDYVRDAGCFVLPSIYEPWGVVVHEAALMGLPMLCSDQIQAATAYLEEGRNGFKFDPLDEDSMIAAFLKVMQRTGENLVLMGCESFKLGMSYKNTDWARTALEMVK